MVGDTLVCSAPIPVKSMIYFLLHTFSANINVKFMKGNNIRQTQHGSVFKPCSGTLHYSVSSASFSAISRGQQSRCSVPQLSCTVVAILLPFFSLSWSRAQSHINDHQLIDSPKPTFKCLFAGKAPFIDCALYLVHIHRMIIDLEFTLIGKLFSSVRAKSNLTLGRLSK